MKREIKRAIISEIINLQGRLENYKINEDMNQYEYEWLLDSIVTMISSVRNFEDEDE